MLEEVKEITSLKQVNLKQTIQSFIPGDRTLPVLLCKTHKPKTCLKSGRLRYKSAAEKMEMEVFRLIFSIIIMSVLSFTVAETAESFRSFSAHLRQYFFMV
jgi:hypothetical protein